MSYSGGVVSAVQDRAAIEAIYACLRLALRQGTVAQPYGILRGDVVPIFPLTLEKGAALFKDLG